MEREGIIYLNQLLNQAGLDMLEVPHEEEISRGDGFDYGKLGGRPAEKEGRRKEQYRGQMVRINLFIFIQCLVWPRVRRTRPKSGERQLLKVARQ